MLRLPSLGELDQRLGVRIYLCTAPTDMRKGFDTLAALVREFLGHDALALARLTASHRPTGARAPQREFETVAFGEMINAQPRRKSWRGFFLRHSQQVCLDHDLPPLSVRHDPPAGGKQGRPLGLHVLPVEEAGQVLDPLQQFRGDGVGIQVAADDANDPFPARGQDEQLIVDLGKLLGDQRVVPVEHALGDPIDQPTLLLLGQSDVAVDPAGIKHLAAEQLPEAAN